MTSKIPECSICFEHYNDQSKCPRLLSCGHSFCSSCLERLLHGNTIDCPTCRNPGAVPTWVEELLKNLHYWTLWMTHPKKMLGVIQAHMIVKLVVRSTLQISAALTAKKTCAKLRLSFILATRRVAIIKLSPLRNWKQTLSLLLFPSYGKNTMMSSGFWWEMWSCSL